VGPSARRAIIRRREFVALIGAAAVWPRAASGQGPGNRPTIGFLGPLSQSAMSQWTAAFVQRLHELGWTEGHNVEISYRWAEGRSELMSGFLAEFVQKKVSIIVTGGADAVVAAKRTTSTIPVVFGTAGDPVGLGLVASLARPGGNITGLSNQSADLPGKRLELLRQVVPDLRRLAILANVDSPIGVLEMSVTQAAARSLGLDVASLQIRQAADIAPAVESVDGHADGLYVVTEPLVDTNRVQINVLALKARLPTIYAAKSYVKDGGLLSYGPDFPDLFRRAGDYVDKILHGTKPSDLPVEQPTKFDLAVNLTTAKALGLSIPPSILAIADDVIN
jgi:putative ABC transport system substrate-binding protein